MLKKRLIGVVTIKDGWAVQSIGYQRYLPLGNPECLVENLDRWGVDEILLQVIDRSLKQLGPDIELLARIASLGLETPLIYAGGIRTVNDGVRAIQSGADRVVVDAILHDDPSIVCDLSQRLGAQAIIAGLPLSLNEKQLLWRDYRDGNTQSVSVEILNLIKFGAVSEVLLMDWKHEGYPARFEIGLLNAAIDKIEDVPIIVFGGISEPAQIADLLLIPNVAAVAVGNFLNYREHAVQSLKIALASFPIRSPVYESHYS